MENIEKILEKIDSSRINLDSFKVKHKLNPKIWKSPNKMNQEVRKQLLKIADDFFEFLDLPWVEVIDVTITGSLANYTWSKYSDIDLHIIIDYKEVNENYDLVSDYLSAKKKIWNDRHDDLRINNYHVEVYAQDVNEKHMSSGIYSLEQDAWIIKPKRIDPKLDKETIKEKSTEIINKIYDIEDLFNNEQYDDVINEYTKLWEYIKEFRKKSLNKGGEFSIGNIVFKVLRRSGYLEKLIDLKNRSYELENSLIIDQRI